MCVAGVRPQLVDLPPQILGLFLVRNVGPHAGQRTGLLGAPPGNISMLTPGCSGQEELNNTESEIGFS